MQGKDRYALRRDQTWETQDWLITVALMNRVCECATQMQDGGMYSYFVHRGTLSKSLMFLNRDQAFQRFLRTERMWLCYIPNASIAEAPLSNPVLSSQSCTWI